MERAPGRLAVLFSAGTIYLKAPRNRFSFPGKILLAFPLAEQTRKILSLE